MKVTGSYTEDEPISVLEFFVQPGCRHGARNLRAHYIAINYRRPLTRGGIKLLSVCLVSACTDFYKQMDELLSAKRRGPGNRSVYPTGSCTIINSGVNRAYPCLHPLKNSLYRGLEIRK